MQPNLKDERGLACVRMPGGVGNTFFLRIGLACDWTSDIDCALEQVLCVARRPEGRLL